MPNRRKLPDRRVVYCLLCNKPQMYITTHLAKRCMAQEPLQQRQAEVVRAKRSMKRWTLRGRRWDFSLLRKWCKDPADRYQLLRHLEENDFLVINTPNEEELARMREAAVASDEARPRRAAATQLVEDAAASEAHSPASSEEEASHTPTARVSKGCRKTMKRLGLYEQVPSDDPLIHSYRLHLKQELKICSTKKEIASVCRWLHFLLPDAGHVSVQFVRCVDKVGAYIAGLKQARLSKATISANLDSLIRFVGYVKEKSGPEHTPDCEAFAKALKSAQQGLRSEEGPVRSAKLVIGPETTLYHCQRVLRRAQGETRKVQSDLEEERYVTEEQKTRLRYYCVALLLLKMCVKPSVVENMKARDWLDHTRYGGFLTVTCHSKDARVSSFALGEDDASLLQTYFTKVRSVIVQQSKTAESNFFLRRSGSVISNAHVELSRLHRHFNLPVVSSQDARLIAARDAKLLSEKARDAVLLYLGIDRDEQLPPQSALNIQDLAMVASNLNSLASSPSGRHQTPKRTRETSPEGGTEMGNFFQQFPVKLDGRAPTKRQRQDKGFSPDRRLYDRWRSEQRQLRKKHLLSNWTRQKPSLLTVQGYIKSSGWTSNCVSAQEVLEGWTPPPTVNLQNDSELIGRIKNQSWPGLTIAESKMPRAGYGVFATKDFSRGSVICDYHGSVVKAEEGRSVLQALKPGEDCYVFFFKAGDQNLCVNSQIEPCECHPQKATFGRRINHSSKRFNVKGMVFSIPGEALPVLLIKATRNIKAGEELLIDYGVTQKSFGGEAQGLSWLDD